MVCNATGFETLPFAFVHSLNPRLDFIKVLQQFFARKRQVGTHPSAVIENGAKIGENVSIGPFVYIGSEVEVGDECVISEGVSLKGKLKIGSNCRIKANAVLGEDGFGFEYDEDGTPIHFPHLGGIILEDGVFIGSCATVERGTLGDTILRENVKVDDHVQVGHNCEVECNTLIMAGAVLCGGVKVGSRCWIAPNSSIKEKVIIGDNVLIGLGAVVLKEVPSGLRMAGVPAKPI